MHDDLDVRKFLASPRHAHYFATSTSARAVIQERREQLLRTGKLPGKTPIVNMQAEAEIIELHDGNTSAVAWLLYAETIGARTYLVDFAKCFSEVILLTDRVHPNGEVWHPFVPPEVACAADLQIAYDAEQGREVRKAVTVAGRAVSFNDLNYFRGTDLSECLGVIADAFSKSVELAIQPGRSSTPK